MKEWPRVKPDVELVNKFIRCCLVCGDAERGLVFLSALSDCSVEPNVHTFTLLLQVLILDIAWLASMLVLADVDVIEMLTLQIVA